MGDLYKYQIRKEDWTFEDVVIPVDELIIKLDEAYREIHAIVHNYIKFFYQKGDFYCNFELDKVNKCDFYFRSGYSQVAIFLFNPKDYLFDPNFHKDETELEQFWSQKKLAIKKFHKIRASVIEAWINPSLIDTLHKGLMRACSQHRLDPRVNNMDIKSELKKDFQKLIGPFTFKKITKSDFEKCN